MKRVSLILCLVLVPLVTLAQGEPGRKKSSLGANFELSIPMGDFSYIAGTGYGGNLRYQYGSDAQTAFTATAGYMVWSKKEESDGSSVQPKAITIFCGGKYYIAPGFYGSLEAGLYFMSYRYEGTRVAVEGGTARFMVPIGIGYQKSGFELGVRYMIFDVNFSGFSFTLGYNFMP
jgi:hypothetical protein